MVADFTLVVALSVPVKLLKGAGAIAVVGVISFSLALAAFRGRLKAGA